MKVIRDYRKNSAIASERRVTLAFKRFTFALARRSLISVTYQISKHLSHMVY